MQNSLNLKKRSVANEPHCARESDLNLIAATRRGEGQAFEILFKRHQKRIFSVALGICRNREDAEDVVQQCFMKAFVHLEAFAGQSAFSTWLTRIAINEALMNLRKLRPQTAVLFNAVRNDGYRAAPFEIADSAAGVEERYAQLERAHILSTETNRLPPEMRRALQLTLENRTIAETAEIMRVSVSTVKARLFRARRKLRSRLTRFLEQVSDVDATNGARAA